MKVLRFSSKLVIGLATPSFVLAACGQNESSPGTRSDVQALIVEEGGCAGLNQWVGNDWRLTIAQGQEVEHEGRRYSATQAIDYPNSECAPDAPASWCSGWFIDVGSCEDAPTPSCSDETQNQGEEGVDCGGPCPACAVAESCSDGIQNQDEEGVDCGGSCAACPEEASCSDGIHNQGEEAVDCGGPCTACLEETPASIPGRVEAEDFVRFADSTSGHSGDCGSGPVDQQTTTDAGGGCNVGWTAAGEWLEYDVNLAEAGFFEVALRVASNAPGREAEVSIDGASIGIIEAAGTGWQSWETQTLADVQLGAGAHTIRIEFLDGNLNLNWLSVEAQDETGVPEEPSCDDDEQNQGEEGVDCGGPCDACPTEAVVVPAQIQAEDFVRFYDTTASHSGDCGSGPVDQQTTTDVGGGCNVGWTAAGEWLEYDIEVSGADVFDIPLRLASSGFGNRVQVTVDGGSVGTVTAPSSGWQSWAERTVTGVPLSAGRHTIRITFLDGSVNLNWLSVAQAADNPPGTHPDIVKVIDVPGRNPGGVGWMDSYSVGDRCYCDTTFDHAIGSIVVSTPSGNRTVREVCEAIGDGPGRAGRPIYNDIQCGNGPANDAGDEDDCPGRVDIGPEGCGHIGPTWNFDGVSL